MVITASINSFIVIYMLAFPAKSRSELDGKGKKLSIIAGICFFLMFLTLCFVGYFLLISSVSSLGLFLIFIVISLGFGAYQGYRLYLLQISRFEIHHSVIQKSKMINENESVK